MSLKESFTFSVVQTSHQPLILEWFEKEHVCKWFHGEGLQNTISGLKKFLNGEESPWIYWVAFCNGEPFGFLMTSTVEESEAEDSSNQYAKWIEQGEKVITLDLLIGEERYLGRGLASRMIREFLLDQFSDASVVFIDPESSNTKAIHVYEKVGFKKQEQFIASWHPVPHWMMRLKMEELKELR